LREGAYRTVLGSLTSSGGGNSGVAVIQRELPRIEAYDGVVRGELKYAMSASISTPLPHHIGIVVCAEGRLLMCTQCELSFEFPDGKHYRTIAKQFESHLCSSPSLSHGDTLKVAYSNKSTAKVGKHIATVNE